MVTKIVNVRLDKDTFNKIKTTAKEQKINHSDVIRDALRLYYEPLPQQYNTDLVTVLKAQITDLQQERDNLQKDNQQMQHRILFLSLPWYRRIFQRQQLKAHE